MKTSFVFAGLIAVLFGMTATPAEARDPPFAINASLTDNPVGAQPAVSARDFSRSERHEMRVLVQSYLWAISNRQADLLFLTAAESVTSIYSTPEALMRRMTQIHRPALRGSLVRFDGVGIQDGLPVQNVYIKDELGRQWWASYLLEKQADGRWKIAGCLIMPAPGQIV